MSKIHQGIQLGKGKKRQDGILLGYGQGFGRRPGYGPVVGCPRETDQNPHKTKRCRLKTTDNEGRKNKEAGEKKVRREAQEHEKGFDGRRSRVCKNFFDGSGS